MRIENTSQELFIEAIRRLPAEPIYVDVTALADGIPLPASMDEVADYIGGCTEHNVAPFSYLELQYSGKGSFIPSRRCSGKIQIPSQQGGDACTKGLLQGSRSHLLGINIRVQEAREGFKAFRNGLLDDILENGYHLASGDLRLLFSVSDYDRGCGLAFDAGSGLELYLSTGISEEHCKQLVSWLEVLKGEYQPG